LFNFMSEKSKASGSEGPGFGLIPGREYCLKTL
jgi:hypothetical protein